MNTEELLSRHRRPIKIGDAINQSLDLAEKNQLFSFGIPAGFPSLDRLTQGWNPGDLVILGARPAVGKTLLALAMARNAAVGFGEPTAYFSLETSSVQLTNRLIATESGVPVGKLLGKDKIDGSDWQRMEASLYDLAKAPLYIDDTPGLRITEFGKRVRSMAGELGVRLAVVDDFRLLLPDEDEAFPSRHAELEDNLRRLKETAVQSGVAILVLTWVRRPVRKNYTGPVLADLDPYCPSAEYHADRILLLHRPSFLNLAPEQDRLEPFEVRVVSNRNGATGTVHLLFDREAVRLLDPEATDWK